VQLEEGMAERGPDIKPLVRVKVEQPADEVAEALAGDRLLGDDGLGPGQCARVSATVTSNPPLVRDLRTSSVFMPLRNFFDALSVVAFG
jgi:hypothetical protein